MTTPPVKLLQTLRLAGMNKFQMGKIPESRLEGSSFLFVPAGHVAPLPMNLDRSADLEAGHEMICICPAAMHELAQ